jgi:hypothetical protein
MGTVADYPPPTMIAQTTGTGVQPNIIDATPFITPGYPPVVEIYISATATVVIYGGLALSAANPPTILWQVDVSNGGVTSSVFKDLIVGIPFYAFNITANTGTVAILCGQTPSAPGQVATPSVVRMTTNSTLGM